MNVYDRQSPWCRVFKYETSRELAGQNDTLLYIVCTTAVTMQYRYTNKAHEVQ